MAVDVSGNPWTVNAVDASATPIWKGEVFIDNIEFMLYAFDTDVCVITDLAGRVVWNGNGAADLETVRSGKIGWVHGGLIVSSITTSGTVRIYIK